MDNTVRRNLKVFNLLTVEQKKEFLESIEGYQVKGKLEEGVRKELGVSMGPLPGVCAYCGK
jgi:hypothetical protein